MAYGGESGDNPKSYVTWRGRFFRTASGTWTFMKMFRKPWMSMPVAIGLLWTFTAPPAAAAQDWRWTAQQVVAPEVSLRGISVLDRNVIWVTGTRGTVYRTENGGATWEPLRIPDAGTLDFRDVEVLSPEHVLVMSAGEGATSAIFRTDDGGRTWSRVSPPTRPETFYDGFAFWNAREGILGGDPVGGEMYLLTTRDGGRTWQRVAPESLPPLAEGETGAFAASGSNVAVAGDRAWAEAVAPGGSRVARSRDRGATWEIAETPMFRGSRTRGIFGLDFLDERTGVAVGGDYTNEGEGTDNVILTDDGGESWRLADTFPVFQSAVRYLDRQRLVSVGPAGGYASEDGGRTWRRIPGDGYHTLDRAEDGTVWAAGSNGRVARLAAE